MNFSNSFKVTVWIGETLCYSRLFDRLELPYEEEQVLNIRFDEDLRIQVECCEGSPRLVFKFGGEIIYESKGLPLIDFPLLAPFHSDFGESFLSIDEVFDEEDREFGHLVSLMFWIDAKPEVLRDYQVMIEDVEEIHQGLAQDVISRGLLPRGVRKDSRCFLFPGQILEALRSAYGILFKAVSNIAGQPSSVLSCERRVRRYRAGDRLDASSVNFACRSSEISVSLSGHIRNLGRVSVKTPVISQDIEEHRHIAYGIRDLALRAGNLSSYCGKMTAYLQHDERVWGRARVGKLSVFEENGLPRIEALRNLEFESRALKSQFEGLLRLYPILQSLPKPHTPFRTTPIFQGRTAYREAFRALTDFRRKIGVLVDGTSIRMSYRSLPVLYEYWCFVKAVSFLRSVLGPSFPRDTFTLIDDVYRPELKPNQSFLFGASATGTVTITYQMEICPWREARRSGQIYGATLTRDPLRPDILIEALRPGKSPTCMVLDAKSSDCFNAGLQFRNISDYSRQIFHIPSESQPVREVYLLHRDRTKHRIDNLPLLRRSARDLNVIGGIPCVPEKVGAMPERLKNCLEKFLDQNR